MKQPTFVDLFAGAGLFSHAFRSNGFRPLLSVELDPVACDSYRHNVGNHIVCGDVRKVTPTDACDVLAAGPPCQGFSTLNRHRENDCRNALAFDVIRWVDHASPKIVVIENVAPFLDSPEFVSFARRLRRRSYKVDAQVVQAADYGVPQNRRRAILIASRIGEASVPQGNSRRVRSVRDAWKGLPPDPTGERHHESPKPSPLALARFQAIPPGGDRRSIMHEHPHLVPPSWWRVSNNVNTGVWGRMHLDHPAPTIRTNFQNPSKGRYIHPIADRVISVREGARLQGIPDSWIFHGFRTQVTRQIGNGVPIRLGKAIARHCKKLLEF